MKNYFKKFSIMFVILLAIISVGAIQKGSVANAITKGDVITTEPEDGWKRYDDTDTRFAYTGSWEKSSAVSGWYKNTGRWIQPDGNESIKFTFYGTEIRYYTNMNNSCSSSIRINIDGKEELFNAYSTISYTTSTPSTLVYEKTGLALGFHTVVVNVNMNVSGIYNGFRLLGFDAIDIDSDGYLVDPNQSISLDNTSINLTANDSKQLTATTTPAGVGVTWKSSDSSVATVDSTGKVSAIKEGQATITVTTTDGSNLSSACTVNVTNPITPGITLNKTSDSLTTGQTDNLVATTTPSGAQVTWTSSDANIATVDSTGKITAIKAGTVTITASTSNGLTAACALTVTNPTNNTGGTSTGTDGTSTIVNIAHAKGDNTNNAGGDVSIIFNGLPDTTLSVVKTADVKSVYVGDTFTYTIVVTNTGAKTAKSVVINDSAPNHIQFMPSGITTTQGTVDPSSTSSNILVNVGDIPPLGTVTIKIPATVIL